MDSPRSRRVPIRYVIIAVVVLAVGLSERWGGPFTFAAMQDAGASLTGSAGPDAEAVRDTSGGEVHLTFDDGPSDVWTAQVLDVLAEHDARAVFFPIGNQIEPGAEVLRRAIAEGHSIGNHTWNHERLTTLTADRFADTVGRTQAAAARLLDRTPACLRAPGGAIDATVERRAAEVGLSVTRWTVDPSDWSEPGVDAIVDNVLTDVHDGAVVLLHDGGGDRGQTVDALERILPALDRAGYRFTVVPGC